MQIWVLGRGESVPPCTISCQMLCCRVRPPSPSAPPKSVRNCVNPMSDPPRPGQGGHVPTGAQRWLRYWPLWNQSNKHRSIQAHADAPLNGPTWVFEILNSECSPESIFRPGLFDWVDFLGVDQLGLRAARPTRTSLFLSEASVLK